MLLSTDDCSVATFSDSPQDISLGRNKIRVLEGVRRCLAIWI